MTMTRYRDREYYGKVAEPFSKDGESIEDFKNGHIAYYVPGGFFAIFFDNEDEYNQSDLIRMGIITSDLEAFNNLDESVKMHIEIRD
jgi:hypothetical protein